MFIEDLAVVGQRYAPDVTGKELNTELFLEILDLMAERRLRGA